MLFLGPIRTSVVIDRKRVESLSRPLAAQEPAASNSNSLRSIESLANLLLMVGLACQCSDTPIPALLARMVWSFYLRLSLLSHFEIAFSNSFQGGLIAAYPFG